MFDPKGLLFFFRYRFITLSPTWFSGHISGTYYVLLTFLFALIKKKINRWKLSHGSDFPLQASLNAYVKTNLGDPAKVLISKLEEVHHCQDSSDLSSTPLSD